MKAKAGRDYLEFNDCYAKTLNDGSVFLYDISDGFKLSYKEFSTLVKFVEKQKEKLNEST